MKKYTIYDNANDGFTICYSYLDAYSNKTIIKKIQCYNKESMIKFKKDLESKGYKFVGKL